VAAVSSLGVIRTRAAYLAVFRRPSVKRDAEGGIHVIGALKNRCSSTVSDSSLEKNIILFLLAHGRHIPCPLRCTRGGPPRALPWWRCWVPDQADLRPGRGEVELRQADLRPGGWRRRELEAGTDGSELLEVCGRGERDGSGCRCHRGSAVELPGRDCCSSHLWFGRSAVNLGSGTLLFGDNTTDLLGGYGEARVAVGDEEDGGGADGGEDVGEPRSRHVRDRASEDGDGVVDVTDEEAGTDEVGRHGQDRSEVDAARCWLVGLARLGDSRRRENTTQYGAC
jgi:hypothetical protein